MMAKEYNFLTIVAATLTVIIVISLLVIKCPHIRRPHIRSPHIRRPHIRIPHFRIPHWLYHYHARIPHTDPSDPPAADCLKSATIRQSIEKPIVGDETNFVTAHIEVTFIYSEGPNGEFGKDSRSTILVNNFAESSSVYAIQITSYNHDDQKWDRVGGSNMTNLEDYFIGLDIRNVNVGLPLVAGEVVIDDNNNTVGTAVGNIIEDPPGSLAVINAFGVVVNV